LIARERAPKASTEDMFHGNPGTRGGGAVPEKPETEFTRKQTPKDLIDRIAIYPKLRPAIFPSLVDYKTPLAV
jgi:hypothetical protein